MLYLFISPFPSTKTLKKPRSFRHEIRYKVYRRSPTSASRVGVLRPTKKCDIPNKPNRTCDGSRSELHLVGELLEAVYRSSYLAEYLFPAAAKIHSHCQTGSDDLAHGFVGKSRQDLLLLGLEDHHIVEAVPVRCDVLHLRRLHTEGRSCMIVRMDCHRQCASSTN